MSKKGTFVRLVVPDSHGNHIDLAAAKAFLVDAKRLDPESIVFLGDHIDAGGTFNAHQRTYTNEMCETFYDDVTACNWFFDAIQKACPRATDLHAIEGNHEQHVERWAARNFDRFKDAEMFLEKMGPAAVLKYKERGIKYYRRDRSYQGIGIQGTFRLGKCYFTHGVCANKHATAVHLEKFADNVVHGHTHRSQAILGRTVTKGCIGAWCPGTLAKQQPLYMHTNPTSWTHGYGVQFVSRTSGVFLHFNVPIAHGKSMLGEMTAIMGAR
jgi:predicted phosphodiesterase